MVILTENQAHMLMQFIAEKLANTSCNNKLKFAKQWAMTHNVDQDDFEDAMIEHGCGCDCEILLNLPEEGVIEIDEIVRMTDEVNPFKIPSLFIEDTLRTYTKALFTSEDLDYNRYTKPNELLIPAPYGHKPKKKIAKNDWFFLSTKSELPNIIGFVKEIEPVTAIEFAKQVRATEISCLHKFSPRAAAYFLSRIDLIPVGSGAWCHFLERTGIGGFSADLKINKVVR